MPAPPGNYIDITAVPFSQTVTQADFNAGTFGDAPNQAWFRYVAAADVALGTFTDKGGTFTPRIRLYADAGGTMVVGPSANDSQAMWQHCEAGETYWIEVVNLPPGPSDFDFTTTADTAPVSPAVPNTSILINDDEDGYAATIHAEDGTFLGLLPGIPAGEIGDSLPSGIALYHDEFGALGAPLALFNSANVYVSSGDTSPGVGAGVAPLVIGNDGDTFYVVHVSTGDVFTVSSTGTITGPIATIVLNTRPVSAAGVSRDGTTLYWAEGDGYDGDGHAAIQRHDLSSDTPLSRLYIIPALETDSGWVATTGVNNQPGEILVLGDESVVTWYRNDDASTDTLLHISSAGTLQASYEYAHPIRINHIAYPPTGSDDLRIWWFLDDTASTGRIATISLATGSSSVSFDTPHFVAGVNQVVGSTQLFGPSSSCTMVTAGYTIEEVVVPPEDDAVPGPCCGTTGPGNAPTSTGYNGTGSTGTRGTTPPTLTPRIVPPGGDDPSYATCSSGGGTPATASDPVDAQDLVTCKTPRVHMKWTLPDASVRRYGKSEFTSGNGQAVSARVLRWGGVSQVLSDRHGSFQANQFTVTLSDTDRAIRTILSTASTKYVDGKEVEILIESAANAALSVNPLVLARGVVTDYKFRPDMTVDITVTDPLGYRYSSVSIDRPIPGRVCRKELFPNLPEETSGRPQPIIYGEQSDDYAWSLDAARTPVGILPVIYVGPANTISAAGIPGGEWEAFLIAGHAISCVQSVFASNLEDSPGSVRMSTDTYGSEFLLPGIDADLYYDITGSDGVTERVCLMFATGDRATAHIEGQVPITINVAGIEDVGDGSGDTITEIALQFQHFLSCFVVQNYLTGVWGSLPTFGDGTTKVRTSSFSAVNAIHAARLGTSLGYIGGLYIGDQKPARDWAKEFQQGGDMRLGVNHQGQLLVTTLDHTQSTTGLTEFTAQDDMVTQSFQIDPQISEIFNVYTYEYGVEPATGRKSGLAQTIRHLESITNHGERIAQASVNRCTNRKATADDVANRALLESYDAPTDVSFDLDLRGTALTLGQIVKATHYQGIGPLGWTDRNLVVTGTTAYPDEDNFSTSIELEDWHDVLALGGSVLSIDTGTIDTYTIG
jgi:hypothetical protein